MPRTRPAGSSALRSSIVPVGLILLCGLTALTIQSSASVDAQDASGADLYAANCAGCHVVCLGLNWWYYLGPKAEFHNP